MRERPISPELRAFEGVRGCLEMMGETWLDNTSRVARESLLRRATRFLADAADQTTGREIVEGDPSQIRIIDVYSGAARFLVTLSGAEIQRSTPEVLVSELENVLTAIFSVGDLGLIETIGRRCQEAGLSDDFKIAHSQALLGRKLNAAEIGMVLGQ